MRKTRLTDLEKWYVRRVAGTMDEDVPTPYISKIMIGNYNKADFHMFIVDLLRVQTIDHLEAEIKQWEDEQKGV